MKILGWVLVICGVGVAMGQGPVGAKRAMTFADLMGMKRVSDPQVSASGKWVMFSVTEVSLEKNTKVNHLWVVGLEGGGSTTAGPSTALRSAQDDNLKERQVTAGAGETFGRFSPDGKWVSYSMGGQIWVAGWDEGKGTVGVGRKLTDVAGGADGAIWAPDSKRLMFVGEVWPGCSVVGGERAGVGKADSSASLRNDKQEVLGNDKEKRTGAPIVGWDAGGDGVEGRGGGELEGGGRL